jgi:WD40 repeat protein
VAVALLVLLAGPKAVKQQRMVFDIEVEPDDHWLAVSDDTDDVWIYSTKDGKLLRTLHHRRGSHLIDIEISPDKQHILCSNMSWTGDYTPVWSTKTWKEVAKLGIPMTQTVWDAPNSLEYAGGGKYAIGPTTYGHQLVAWNALTGAVAYVARKNAHFGSFGIAVNAKTAFVAVHEPEVGRIRFWEFEGSSKTRLWGNQVPGINNKAIRMMRFSPSDQKLFLMVAITPTTSMFYVCKPSKGQTVVDQKDKIEGFNPRDMAWSWDDKVIYLGGLNGRIVCFSPLSATIQKHWIGHNAAPIRAVAAFHHGPQFVTGGTDTVCIWRGVDGKLVRTITLPPPSK